MTLDPIESASKGAAKAVLESSMDMIHKWVEKLKNRELSFIGDTENITLVKEQRNGPEWALYSQYAKDQDLRICIQMGMALRKLEKNATRLQNLRDKIRKRFGPRGLHIAQFVQNQILGKYIEHALQSAPTSDEFVKRLECFLKDIDKFWLFIRQTDNIRNTSDTCLTRIRAFSPPIFVLASNRGARQIAAKIQKNPEKALPDYEVEEYNDKTKKIVFFNKMDGCAIGLGDGG